MRLTREIDYPQGRILFSPLRAGSLAVGDMIASRLLVASHGDPWRVTSLAFSADGRRVTIGHTGSTVADEVDANYPILRAVGAGVGGGGVR